LFQKVSPFLSMQGFSVILCDLCTAGCMAWNRVLDLCAEVMLPPLAGKTEVQLQAAASQFTRN